MTITLTPAQEQMIQRAIQQGIVRSVNDFLETALQSLDRPSLAAQETSGQQELVRKGRFLLYTGAPPEGFDPVSAVHEFREEQARSVLNR